MCTDLLLCARNDIIFGGIFMSKFDKRKIAATLAFASLFSGKSQAMETKSPQTLAAVGGATIASKNLPVKKGLSTGAKIGIVLASILTLGAVAALTVWGVKSKGNKEPEGTEPNIKGPNNEKQDIESSENGSEKEKDIVKISGINIVDISKSKEKEQNIVGTFGSKPEITVNKSQNIITGSKIEENKQKDIIITKEKIVEKKQEQSNFFKLLHEQFEYEDNNFVDEKIYVGKVGNPKATKVELSWTPAAIFKKMFEAIANESNSKFLHSYFFNNLTNGKDEYKKLIGMISGKVKVDTILLKKSGDDYVLQICDDVMKTWGTFKISNLVKIADKTSATITIKLVSNKLVINKSIIEVSQAINLDALMNEGKFKSIDEN